MPYYIGDLKRDLNFENYPYVMVLDTAAVRLRHKPHQAVCRGLGVLVGSAWAAVVWGPGF